MRGEQWLAICILWMVSALAFAVEKPLDVSFLDGLPQSSDWRTFAKPLPIGEERLLLFQREHSLPVLWTVDWQSGAIRRQPIALLPLPDEQRMSAAYTAAGLWLVGARVRLLRQDGGYLDAELDSQEPIVLADSDTSILVVGAVAADKALGQRILRVAADATGKALKVEDLGRLSFDGEANRTGERYREPRFGVSAVLLRNGKLLLLGGSGTERMASLFDPRTGRYQATPNLPHSRSNAATLRLPDGRVAVAGAEFLRCHGDSATAVDIFDPEHQQWQALPTLPMPLCATAYGADRPSIAIDAAGGLLLGGSVDNQVLHLVAQPGSTTGFAADWTVKRLPGLSRVSGVIQPLADGRVASAGGVHATKNWGGCCRATPGVALSRLPSASARFDSVVLTHNGPAAAQRGHRLFLASGRAFSSLGSGQMRYSRLAELLDLDSGRVEALPALPFATGAGDAQWLDDDRILFKGRLAADDRRFDASHDSLSSYLPTGEAGLAIYHLAERRWERLPTLPVLDRTRLQMVRGDLALLVPDGFGGAAYLYSLSQASVRPLLHFPGSALRWLADDRLVLAGQAPADLVTVYADDCRSEAIGDCEEGFAGFGSTHGIRYAVLTLSEQQRPTGWQLSAASRGTDMKQAIAADGRVVKLGWLAEKGEPATDSERGGTPLSPSRPIIEFSRADGLAWTTLPLPESPFETTSADTGNCRSYQPDGCELLLLPDPRERGRELLFLRTGAIAMDDRTPSEERMRVWWFDEARGQWQLVLDVDGASARQRPLALPSPLSTTMLQMSSLGWHLQTPVLWLRPVASHRRGGRPDLSEEVR
jgi:hypothetical protein